VYYFFVCDDEFAYVVSDHFGFYVEGCEFFSAVDQEVEADHFWDDDHISAMGLDGFRVLRFASSVVAD
jgi:hypothetical protein